MTILKETMLVLVSADANSNKFYHVTLSDTGVVTKRYGRVGANGVTNSESTGEAGYNRVIASKVKKGYKPTDIVSESSESVKADNLSEIAKTALLGTDGGANSTLLELVDRLVKMNNHDILEASGGLIKVNSDGLISTPLGQVTTRSINEASRILTQLQATPVTSSQYVHLMNDYLTLVPQKVESKRGWHERFFNDNNTVFDQREFLKQLNESLALREERKKAAVTAQKDADSTEDIATKYAELFRFKLAVLEDGKEFDRVNTLFEKGKSSNHPTRNFRLKRVYVLNQGEEHCAKYEEAKKTMGNVLTTWHGTRAGNLLSILRKGLFVPNITGTSIPIQGRMFGSGVYFAPSMFGPFDSKVTARTTNIEKYTPGKIAKGGATKSLNYSSGGVWDRGPRDNRCFMLLNEVVLGREFHPTTTSRMNTYNDSVQKSGNYDSIYAHADKAGLRHDEIIVWNTDQISLRYLCEFEG